MNSSISKICFGCEPLGGTDWGDVDLGSVANAIDYAVDNGINFFDTAPVYGLGLSEERLSNILGEKRHDVFIASKCGLSWQMDPSSNRANVVKDSSPIAIEKSIEASLKRLRIDALPICYVHWPDPNTDIRFTFEALMKIRDSGKIRFIGCSNFDTEQLQTACEVADIAFTQNPFNVLTGILESKFVDVCRKYSVRIVAYNVLANGLLTGKYDENYTFPSHDRRSRLPLFQGKLLASALKQISGLKKSAASLDFTLAQYSIDWVLKQSHVSSVILGIKNKKQLIENLQSL